MANEYVNKVTLSNGDTLIDLTGDTVTQAAHIVAGFIGHLASGEVVTGTGSGGGATGGVTQDQDGYIVLDDEPGTSVTVEALSVTQNGTYTAPTGSAYSPVTVNVSGGGSSSAPKKQINFIDYDGMILHSYTASEWANVSDLPANPSHDNLTSQGWNWTKAQITAQLTAVPNGDIWVGQMYITKSGDTEIDVIFADSARLDPIMTIAVNGTIEVDWGDNTTADTVTGSSLTTMQEIPHSYASVGSYTIKIHVVSGSFTFYGSSSYLLLRKNTTSNENRVYANNIQAVRLGSGITSIGNYAFYYCSSLASVTIPSGVTSFGNNVFSYCSSLASITIPSEVTSLASSAFYNCYSLVSVTIPSGVTSFGNSMFGYCYSLASITIPSGATSLGSSTFYNCYSLASITIPSGVTSLASSVFYTCSSLASVTIPSGVTSFGNSVFYNCSSVASITIPSGVTSLGNTAFSGCYGVAEYHIKPTAPPTLGNNVFNSIVSDCKIYVPSASLTDYQTNWSTYASYMVGE